MTFGNAVPDKTVLKNVERKLMQKCAGGPKIGVTVRNGEATLTGTIKNEHDRSPIVRCAAAVQGVRRVIDQLSVVERQKPSY